MKTTTYLLLLLAIPAFGMAQYCVPPGFKDMGGVGEPFTYISNVQLENLDNSTGMPTGQGNDVGYMYYDSQAKPVLTPGSNYSLKVNLTDNLGNGMHGVVWVDWNGDETFDPTNERVHYMPAAGEHTISLDVPASAAAGTVRMRVYCDMPANMGHIDPEPCGYLNYPNHAIGQHGEVEDYDLVIGAALNVDQHSNSSNLHLFPMPAQEVVHLGYKFSESSTYRITDIYGRALLWGEVGPEDGEINVSALQNGQYILSVQVDQEWVQRAFYVNR